MDSKFNSWPNNDPTDSFTSVLIDASMKVPPHMHSCFIQPVLISLCVPFLIPWHRDMSVGRSPSLRMLECPPVQGSVEDRATVILTEEIHTIIGRVARCGVNTTPIQGWNFLHVSLLPPKLHVPTFPRFLLCLFIVSTGNSVTSLSRHVSSLFAEIFFHFWILMLKLSVLSHGGRRDRPLNVWGRKKGKLPKPSKWSHSTFWN